MGGGGGGVSRTRKVWECRALDVSRESQGGRQDEYHTFCSVGVDQAEMTRLQLLRNTWDT